MYTLRETHAVCPHCGHQNTIIASDMPGGLEIDCSKCRKTIGYSIRSGNLSSNTQVIDRSKVER